MSCIPSATTQTTSGGYLERMNGGPLEKTAEKANALISPGRKDSFLSVVPATPLVTSCCSLKRRLTVMIKAFKLVEREKHCLAHIARRSTSANLAAVRATCSGTLIV